MAELLERRCKMCKRSDRTLVRYSDPEYSTFYWICEEGDCEERMELYLEELHGED